MGYKMLINKTLSEQTYSELKNLIIKRKFKAGQKITEKKISNLLDVSRTTVKKAFTMLVKDGLLEDRPRQGVFIKKFNKEEILELYDIREVLSGLCARYAALNATNKEFNELETIYNRMKIAVLNNKFDEYANLDMELHEKIITYSKAIKSSNIISNFYIILFTFHAGIVRSPLITIKEHREIIDSLRVGNSETAEKLMRIHIRLSREELAIKLKKNASILKEKDT